MTGKPGQIRIIGGQWRGRKLMVPSETGLRPTPDRVRETLFNWLQHVVPGSCCLDLFAGSGALGIEAASRGARHVDLVESNPGVARQLQSQLQRLNSPAIQVHRQDAFVYLEQADRRYDLVLLDPPFGQGLIPRSAEILESNELLAPEAWIYLEAESDQNTGPLPPNWIEHRHKKAGQVGYHLYFRKSDS